MQENMVEIQNLASLEDVLAAKLRSEAIEGWLLSKVSDALALDPDEIDLGEPLASYGMSSIAAVSLTGDLEVWMGTELSPTLVWEYPTIAALTEHLGTLPGAPVR
jgi:acyl carrier protein